VTASGSIHVPDEQHVYAARSSQDAAAQQRNPIEHYAALTLIFHGKHYILAGKRWVALRKGWTHVSEPELAMSTPQDKAAVAAHTYVSSRKENILYTRVVTSLNDFVHLPIVEDVCYTFYWLMHCLLGPIYGVGLLLLLLKDALVGAVVPTLEEAKGRSILVTGCDTGKS
jgi:hypothetical protein